MSLPMTAEQERIDTILFHTIGRSFAGDLAEGVRRMAVLLEKGRGELAEAKRQQVISDGVAANVKTLLEQRTTTLLGRAQKAEAARDYLQDAMHKSLLRLQDAEKGFDRKPLELLAAARTEVERWKAGDDTWRALAFAYVNAEPGSDRCEQAWYEMEAAVRHYEAVERRTSETAATPTGEGPPMPARTMMPATGGVAATSELLGRIGEASPVTAAIAQADPADWWNEDQIAPRLCGHKNPLDFLSNCTEPAGHPTIFYAGSSYTHADQRGGTYWN